MALILKGAMALILKWAMALILKWAMALILKWAGPCSHDLESFDLQKGPASDVHYIQGGCTAIVPSLDAMTDQYLDKAHWSSLAPCSHVFLGIHTLLGALVNTEMSYPWTGAWMDHFLQKRQGTVVSSLVHICPQYYFCRRGIIPLPSHFPFAGAAKTLDSPPYCQVPETRQNTFTLSTIPITLNAPYLSSK